MEKPRPVVVPQMMVGIAPTEADSWNAALGNVTQGVTCGISVWGCFEGGCEGVHDAEGWVEPGSAAGIKKPTWASGRFIAELLVRSPVAPHIRAFARSTVATPGPVGRTPAFTGAHS